MKPLKSEKLQIFKAAYQKQLHDVVLRYPHEYAYSVELVSVVTERMIQAIANNHYNKDSRAIKATCSVLHIPYTYRGIRNFLEA